MKNKKVKGFLLLASCAMLLTGCNPDALWGLGGKWNSLAAGAKGFFDDIALKLGLKKAEQKEEQKEEEKPQEGGEEEQPVEKKLVVDELPHAVAGVEFDMSEFVHVQGGEGDFSLTLSEESAAFAQLDNSGKKVTASHSGEVGLTVSYSGLSEERTLSVDSKEFLAYVEVAKDDLKEYAFYFEDGAEYYSEDLFAYYDSDRQSFIGVAEIAQKIFSFKINVDEQTEAISLGDFLITGEEPEKMSDVCVAYPFAASLGSPKFVPAEKDVIDETAKDYECISISEKKTMNALIKDYFGYSPELMIANDFTPTEIQIVPEAEEQEDGSIEYEWYAFLMVNVPESYVAQDGDPEKYVDAFMDYFELNPGVGTNPFTSLKSQLPSEAPTGADASELFTAFKTAVSAHNFTVTYSANWYIQSGGQWYVYGSNPFASTASGSYIHDYLNFIGSVSAYVTPTQTYVKNGTASYGLVEKDGNVYAYSGEDNEAGLIAENETIFGSSTFADVDCTYQFLNNVDKIFVNSYSEGTATFSLKAGESFMNSLMISSLPNYKSWKAATSYAEFMASCEDITQLYDVLGEDLQDLECEMYYDSTNGEFCLSFVWEDSVTSGGTKYPLAYSVDVTIGDIGTTEIPSSVVPVFPQA